MDDDTTVHESLVEEVHRLRQQLADLQAAERQHQQVEETLRQSETHYRELVHGSIQGICIHQDYIIRFANPALASILGYENSDLLLGTDIRSLTAPHELARLEAYKEALLRGELAPSHYEFHALRRDGTLVWIEAMFAVISWRGTPAILGTVFDITKRKQAEAALAAEAHSLRAQTAVAQVALSSLHPEVLRPRLLEAIARAQGYSQGSLWRLTDDGAGVVIVATYGENLAPFLGLRREMDDPDSLVAEVFRHGRPIFHNRRQERLYAPHSPAAPANRRAFLGLPLRSHGGRVVEVLAFSDVENPERFSERDLVQGAILASQVAQALENSELFSQVQQIQEQCRVMTESLNDAVYTVDQQGRVTFVNTALERLTGYRREELLGRPSGMFYTSDSPAMFARLRQQLSQGEAMPPHLETEVIRRDGARVPAELTVADLVLHGYVTGRIVVARDISTRRRAKATMRENERRWRTVLENVRLVVVGLDLTGHVEYANPFFLGLTGYTAEETLGKYWFGHFLPEAYQQEGSNAHARALSEHLTTTYQNPIRTRAGATRMIAWFNTRLHDAQGNIIGTLSIGEDITERQAAEAQLRLQGRQRQTVATLGLHALAGCDVSTLLHEAVTLVAETLAVEYCKVLELLPDRQALLLRAGVGWHDGLVGQATVGAGVDSQAGYTLLAREPVIVEDLHCERRFSGPPLLHDHGVVSGLSVIIPGHERAFGVLGAHTGRRRTFTPDDVHFFQSVANVLAMAIERQRTEDVLRRYGERLETLHEIDQAILAARSPEAIASAALRHIRRLVPCDLTRVMLFDFACQEATAIAYDSGSVIWGPAVRGLDVISGLDELQQGKAYAVEDVGHPFKAGQLGVGHVR